MQNALNTALDDATNNNTLPGLELWKSCSTGNRYI